ncbi:GntR family transcriptional regulator [Timonella senegalensis]|uniref:GntR family transcriptional regulator n=1 Tax=Timonella senegalensis TaxID=1465825 RepID=UPI0003007ED3|nr:GntR family transcriptional regulator [Timonella senegalensis]
MLYRVDTSSPEPLFEQLAHQVRVAILSGTLQPGDKLPSARELAAALDVNLHTVLHAYQLLRDEGSLELRRGRGAIVTAHSAEVPERVRRAITALVAEADAANLGPDTILTLVKEALK